MTNQQVLSCNPVNPRKSPLALRLGRRATVNVRTDRTRIFHPHIIRINDLLLVLLPSVKQGDLVIFRSVLQLLRVIFICDIIHF